MNRRKIGESYEEAAGVYLQKKGIRLAEKNFRCRPGRSGSDRLGRGISCFFRSEIQKDLRRRLSGGRQWELENKRKYAVWRIITSIIRGWEKAFRYGLTWLQYVVRA